MEVPSEKRVEKVQQKMREKEVDLILLTPGANLKYISGFEAEVLRSHTLLAIPVQGEPRFFAPEIIEGEVGETGIDKELWGRERRKDELSSFLSKYDADMVLLDDKMEERTSRDVRSSLNADLGLATEVMSEVRAVKSEDEISNIREAVSIADKVFEDVREQDPVGMSEQELAEFIEKKMDEYGGEGPSFDVVVAAGSNGADPHHVPSERKIKEGEPVVIDFGCWINGYPSDQTRTMVFGKQEPSENFKEMFRLLREAQERGVSAVKPGNTNLDAGKASRDFLRENGISGDYIKGRGHGIGLEIHEDPKIPPKGDEKVYELEPGMVFTVEPGIYIDGEFGIRIEDVVLVTKEGCERLNKTERNWKTR